MRTKRCSPYEPEMTPLNRLLACASSTVSPSPTENINPIRHSEPRRTNPFNNDSMHVYYPNDESGTSIRSSHRESKENRSFSCFGDLDSDSFVPPIDASCKTRWTDLDDDLLEHDPYLEPLSSLKSRLKASKKSSWHSEEDVKTDTAQTPLSQSSKGFESLKFPLPFITIPKMITLSDEPSVEVDDNSCHPILEDSFTLPISITDRFRLEYDDDTSRHEDRIHHLKKVIQQELQRKVLRHVQPLSGSSSKKSPSAEKTKSVAIASLYMELGALEQQRQSFAAAIQAFSHAATLYRNEIQENALDLARALDAAVVAFCLALQQDGTTGWMQHPQHKVSRCFLNINEAVRIRKECLGTNHVDTLEAVHHMAQLCMLTGEPDRAVPYYIEVIQEHVNIFGPNHPDTAAIAHGLGNAYLQCQDIVSAQKWYQYAGRIYAVIPSVNVSSLCRDTKRLERIHRWTQEDPAQDENLLFEL